jgi:hypothetical protein
MSRSITAEMQVSVKQQLMQELAASPSSRLISELAHPLLGSRRNLQGELASTVGLLTARAGALRAKAGWESVVRTTAPAALSDAQRLLQEAEGKLRTGDSSRATALARQGDERLREALRATAGTLAVQERKEAAGVLERALVSIGCRTTLRAANGFTGISAQRGHQLLVALVEDGGDVKVDIAGCEGDACEPLQRNLEQAVREHGGLLTHVESREHRDDRGGVMMQQAALTAGRDTLADGVVRHAAAAARRSRQEASVFAAEALRQGG